MILKVWPQVLAGETVVGGGPKFSSGSDGVMTAPGKNNGPTKDEEKLKTGAPMVGAGENDGWPASRSRRSASVHGAFSGAG